MVTLGKIRRSTPSASQHGCFLFLSFFSLFRSFRLARPGVSRSTLHNVPKLRCFCDGRDLGEGRTDGGMIHQQQWNNGKCSGTRWRLSLECRCSSYDWESLQSSSGTDGGLHPLDAYGCMQREPRPASPQAAPEELEGLLTTPLLRMTCNHHIPGDHISFQNSNTCPASSHTWSTCPIPHFEYVGMDPFAVFQGCWASACCDNAHGSDIVSIHTFPVHEPKYLLWIDPADLTLFGNFREQYTTLPHLPCMTSAFPTSTYDSHRDSPSIPYGAYHHLHSMVSRNSAPLPFECDNTGIIIREHLPGLID